MLRRLHVDKALQIKESVEIFKSKKGSETHPRM